MIIYGFLLTHGDPKDKVEVLFNILQEGGVTDHASISAGDKDFIPCWKDMLNFATIECFRMTHEINGTPNKFESDLEKIKTICDDEEDQDTDFMLGKMMDDVFGMEGKLDFHVWSSAIAKHAPYMFDTHDLRREVFKWAKVEYDP